MNEIGGMASRQTPILAIIPPPAQFALTFLVGIGVDRLAPWRPAWMAIGGVRWAALALTVAGCSLAVSAVGRFVLRGTTLHPTGQPARLVVNRPARIVAQSDVFILDRCLCRLGACDRKSLAVGLGGAPVGFDELGGHSVRGGAAARSFRRGLRRLLPKGSALDLNLRQRKRTSSGARSKRSRRPST
jgi:hypothetical protein